MPIPFLFIAAAAAGSGLLGIGKGIKAGVDQKEAKDTNKNAQWLIEDAKEKVEISRKNCKKAIDNLGKRKVYVLDGSIKKFISEFEKINHIEIKESSGLKEAVKLNEKAYAELKGLQGIASSLAGGLTSGAVVGAITAFGAYSMAGAFGTASTGTAIASLSGAAAGNATLAFLGGGSMAVGGLGVAGGTALLGGLVAGPALAVFGIVAGAKASKNLDEAKSNYAKAKAVKEEMKTMADLCNGIRKRGDMFNRFLLRIQTYFEPLVYQMSEIIENKGTDYREFSEEERQVIASAMSLAATIKAVIDTPILDEDGNLTAESDALMDNIKKQMDTELTYAI